MDLLWTVSGWIALVFIGAVGLIIVVKMWTNKIDLGDLLTETSNGSQQPAKASLSRFQFLIFTFVIAIGLLYTTFQADGFPEIPDGVYVLLGISGGSYLVSKGIQHNKKPGV